VASAYGAIGRLPIRQEKVMFAKIDYIMVNVSKMERSVGFYRDSLGLPLKFESPGWSEFQTGESTLALHLAPATEGTATSAAGGPVPGTCSIGFSVQRVDDTCAELEKRGVRFVMPPTDRAEEGIRLAVALDPDGLALSFAGPLDAHAQSGKS
jgi:lactoylglutathione lyase